MDSTENRSIKNGQWNGRPSSWRRLCRDGCSSWAAATINLTLHCVKLLLASTGRADIHCTKWRDKHLHAKPLHRGSLVPVGCSPTNTTFSVSVAKMLQQRTVLAATASGSRNPCSATARVNMGRENGSGGDGGTPIAAPLPKIKMRFNS